MLVIMDMEWVDWYNRASPTQITALRVTPDWKDESRFSRLIRPESGKKWPWDHMAFNGYTTQEFLRASDAPTVLSFLSMWLQPDDVLLWWSEPTAVVFTAVWKDLLHTDVPCSMRLIAPVIQEELTAAGLPLKGSAYRMLAAAGVPVTETEHCSVDDVIAIRKLLVRLQIDQEKILNSPAPVIKDGSVVIGPGKNKEYDKSLKYVLDMDHNRAHLTSCPLVPRKAKKRSMATLEGVIRSLVPPCSCCREEYREYSRMRAEENIRKMQLNYVYSEKSGLFHTTSCVHVRNMPYPLIHGSVRYETAVQRGFRPCGFCKPRPEDEKEPRRVCYGAEGQKKSGKAVQERTLSKYKLNAVKRHEQAVRERRSLPSGLEGIKDQDARVLSQSAYAFWMAEGYQTFHLRSCPKLNGLSHLHGYARYGEARRYGMPCKICKPTNKYDILASVPMNQRIRKNETVQQIDALCDRLGWKHEFREDAYFIETPVAKWKLMTGTQPLEVFHMPYNSEGYHRQHRTFLSMTDTVEYIRRHDESALAGKDQEQETVAEERQEKKQERKLDRMIRKSQKSFQRKTRGMSKRALGQ